MIEFAFNSTMSLEEFVKNNNDGSKVFLPSVEIPCYKEDKVKKVVSPTGEEVLSKANYWTTEKVTVNDLLDGSQVLAVEHFSMFGISYYRSYV